MAVIGDNLRRVILKARNPRCDFFHLHNLTYLYGLRFVNMRRPSFCTAFPCATADATVQNQSVAALSVIYSPLGYATPPTDATRSTG